MRWVVAFLFLLGPSSGCSGCGAEQGSAPHTEAVRPSEGSSGSERGEQAGSGDQGGAPTVRVHSEEGLHGEVAVVVESRGPEPTNVRARALLEREDGGRFVRVETGGEVPLGPACEDAPTECLTLFPGAELVSPAQVGKGGCGCRGCETVPEGRYRFVVESCEGKARVPGEPFTYRRR